MKAVLSVFIVLHILIFGLWYSPKCELRNSLLPVISPFVDYFGFWQGFGVFAPDPKRVNLDLSAVITLSDGTLKLYQYPRMEKLGLIERMFKERYRKYGYDYLNWQKEKILWPDAARYIALTSAEENNPAVKVSLIRNWSIIPAPEKGIGDRLPLHTNEFTFFVYAVKPGDKK